VLGLGGGRKTNVSNQHRVFPRPLTRIFENLYLNLRRSWRRAGAGAGGGLRGGGGFVPELYSTYCTRDLGGARRVSTPFGITNAVPWQSQHALSLPDHPRPEHPPSSYRKESPKNQNQKSKSNWAVEFRVKELRIMFRLRGSPDS
jgi:hypothetical protein